MTYGIGYSSVTDGRYRYIKYPNGDQELYDHKSDPHEWNNLISKGDLTAIIAKLFKKIPSNLAKGIGGETEKAKWA